MKRPVKKVLKRLLSRVPRADRARLLTHLMGDDDLASFEDLLKIAHRFNVSELTVEGSYGSFRSTASDASVLGEYARTGTWASQTVGLFQRFFARCGHGTYIDIGANIGLTTVPIAQNPHVRCIAVEPEPTNFRNLQQNVYTNCRFGNVSTLQSAVSFEKGTVEFEMATGNLGDHRMRTKSEPGALLEHTRRTIEVEAVTLDELARASEGPLAIKIDTQGAEPFVVAGGKNTLSEAGLLIMEFWPYGMHRLGGNVEEMTAYIEENFRIMHLLREGEALGTEVSPVAALADLRSYAASKVDDETFYLDIVATKERH